MDTQVIKIKFIDIDDRFVFCPAAGKLPIRCQVKTPAEIGILPAVMNIRFSDLLIGCVVKNPTAVLFNSLFHNTDFITLAMLY